MRLFINILVFYTISLVSCERTKEKIYVSVDGTAACFRRMNGTHQIGCTSDPKGNVGVVHYISKPADLDWLIKSGPHKPYAVLLKPTDFNMETVGRLKASGKVNGIMVIHLPDREDIYPFPESFSPDKSCPNEEYGLYSDSKYSEYRCPKVKWNSYGDNLMFQDLSIPIFIVTNETIITFIIKKCYEKFNMPDGGKARDYPLCAVQLKDRMDGAKDSETCMRRTLYQMNLNPNRYCDPLGDNNVYATIKGMETGERKDKSVIIAAARLDSFAMFDNFYPSADNHVSGIVALLAAAKAIGKVKDKIRDSNTTKDIMFTFFQGEAFDYIGSGRMRYDMDTNAFPPTGGGPPLGLSHISHFVEVNQLAYRDDGKVWIHTDPISRPKVETKVSEMITILKNLNSSLIDEAGANMPLPPASVQSFLKNNDETQFPAVVISDHKKGYTNKYYNSRFDLASAIKMNYAGINRTEWYDHVTEQASSLTHVANVLAKLLYRLATDDNDTDSVTVDEKTVTHLLYCYLISPKCDEFQTAFAPKDAVNLDSNPYPFYVGVNTQDSNQTFSTRRLLLYYLGDKQDNTTNDTCLKATNGVPVYTYVWMQGPKNKTSDKRDQPFCMKGTANYSQAVSVAFELEDYNFNSRKYSTWTESAWAGDAMKVQIFLIPSPKFEVTTLVVGVLILIVSLVGGFFMHKRASILFDTGSPAPSPTPVAL